MNYNLEQSTKNVDCEHIDIEMSTIQPQPEQPKEQVESIQVKRKPSAMV